MDMTLFNYYDDRRVIAFVQDGVPSEDAVLIDEEVLGVQVCAEDTHTLTIPQVLGESIVVTPPAPKVLAQTGNSNIAQALFGLVLIAGAIASARLTQKNSAL
jgi:LPXTG-motif cell wall-anchored protein